MQTWKCCFIKKKLLQKSEDASNLSMQQLILEAAENPNVLKPQEPLSRDKNVSNLSLYTATCFAPRRFDSLHP